MALASTLRLYQNNDVMDGFVCVRHAGKQYNIRVSRRLRPDMGTSRSARCARRSSSRAGPALVLQDNEHGITLDVTCRIRVLPYEARRVTRVDGRLTSERLTYGLPASRGLGAGRRRPHPARPGNGLLLPQPLVGLPGRPRRTSLYGAPLLGVHVGYPASHWVLLTCPTTAGSGSSTPAGGRRPARAPSCARTASCPRVVEHDLQFYEGGRRMRSGTVPLTDGDGVVSASTRSRTSAGSTPRAAVLRRLRRRPRPGRLPRRFPRRGRGLGRLHPTTIVDSDGKSFEFDHAWAENFTRLTCDGQRGLAHFECVVIEQAQEWTDPSRQEPRQESSEMTDSVKQITDLMFRYAELFDTGQLDEFAALFEHGQWHRPSPAPMPPGSGSTNTSCSTTGHPHEAPDDQPGRGRPRRRPERRPPLAYITIFQALPTSPSSPSSPAVTGRFTRVGHQWRWTRRGSSGTSTATSPITSGLRPRRRHMKALILGGTGFVGRRLAEILATSDVDTTILNRGVTPVGCTPRRQANHRGPHRPSGNARGAPRT